MSLDNLTSADAVAEWNTLEQAADSGEIDLIAKADFGGLVYDPSTGNYRSDVWEEPIRTRASMESRIAEGAAITLMGVPVGSGLRMGIDRNLDSIPDGFKPTFSLPMAGTLADATSLQFLLGGPPGMNILLQRSGDLRNWEDWQLQTIGDIPELVVDPDFLEQPGRFYRARLHGTSPWRFASVTGNAGKSRLYIFLNNAGTVHIDDVRLVAGEKAGVGVNHVLNGDFETALSGPWNVPDKCQHYN